MKILLIDVNCKKGSTGKILYDLYANLRANGHEAAICYGRGPLVDEPDILRFSSVSEVYLHALLTRITGLEGYFSPVATRRLLKFMDDFKPDVVHIHELHTYFVNLAPVMEYLKKNKIKTVWTFHCETMYTGKCGYSYDCERWKQGCGKCPGIRGFPKTLFFDYTAKMLKRKKRLFDGFDDLLIAPVSWWLMNRARQSPFLSNKRFQVVHNGIDLDVFHPRETKMLRDVHRLTDEKIIVHVTPDFDDPRKGGRFVIDLARRLTSENVKIIIIGVTNPIKNCPENVIAVNRTQNQQQLAEYYSLGDVFLMASEMENFPTVCLEAICCGTPVIGVDRGGTHETAPSPYGLFVPYRDMELLEQTVRELFAGRIQLATSEQCAQYGREHYDKNLMAANYLKIYAEMVK